MNYPDIAAFVTSCQEAAPDSQIRWCDEERFLAENMPEVSPGGYLNRFDYYVVGTTIGGNAIVLSPQDPRICFADHTWYHEEKIGYKDHAGDKQWHYMEMTPQNVHRSLFPFADDTSQFLEKLRSGEIDSRLDEID